MVTCALSCVRFGFCLPPELSGVSGLLGITPPRARSSPLFTSNSGRTAEVAGDGAKPRGLAFRLSGADAGTVAVAGDANSSYAPMAVPLTVQRELGRAPT